jgi:hypothetical protein
MTIAELRIILGHLQQVYTAAGSKGPAKDLKIIVDVLRPHGDILVSRFVTEFSERLTQGKERRPARKRSTKKSGTASLNETAIGFHVSQLHEAGTEQDSFDEAFNRLNADKSLKLGDVAEIARRYANSVTKYRSLSAARKDISQAFVRRARFENKLQ